MSEALKPCPFCGASARLMGGSKAQESYSVWCTGGRHHLDALGYNADMAIAAWNTRADDPTLSALQEQNRALREKLLGEGIKRVDSQVLSAAADLPKHGMDNPEWAFIDYEANLMSFGRWAKCGKNPAPYIRADLILPYLASTKQEGGE